jgi:hypothetical protein
MSYNYYTYKSKTFNCPKCEWTGLGAETFLGDLSEIHNLRDIECPKCEATLYTFDLAKVELPKDNPSKDEQVCFNCTNMLWMVGIGQGVKCSLTKENIPNRYFTCDQFGFK